VTGTSASGPRGLPAPPYIMRNLNISSLAPRRSCGLAYAAKTTFEFDVDFLPCVGVKVHLIVTEIAWALWS